MKVKNIVLAVAAAIATPSAFAANLVTTAPTVAASNIFYISGASAQTPGLAKAVGKFCTSGLVTYVDSVDGKTAFVYKCGVANTATSGLSGAFIVVKTDAGGSYYGVGPVISQTVQKFPDITNVTVGATPATTNLSDVAGVLTGTAEFTTGANVKPQIGLSDVSAAIWRARGVSFPTVGFTEVAGFAGQGFGVVVSSALYALLQADQGTTGQPSISSTNYANLVSGVDTVWQKLLPNTAVASLPTTLTLARRVATSGTQAASDIYFLRSPCETGTTLGGALGPTTVGVYADATIPGHATTFTVKEESSTGGVKTDVGSGYAIGVISLENQEPTTVGSWRYVKINGVSPNAYNNLADTTQKLSILNGQYDFAYESTLITNDAVTTANANVATLAASLVTDLGEGSNLTTTPGIYADPFNAGGTYVVGQTNRYTRTNNACQVSQLVIQ